MKSVWIILLMVALAGAPSGYAAVHKQPRPLPLVDVPLATDLSVYLKDVCDWVMTLDVGSGALKNTKDTGWSVFINGNFARLLAAGHRIFGEKVYLDESLRWADTFYQQQQLAITPGLTESGFWGDRGQTGNPYLADAGTASTAMAVCYRLADPGRQKLYLNAMNRYARYIREGCLRDPQGKERQPSAGWVIASGDHRGALGCGYYEGHLSVEPYTIATAITGGAFFSELFSLTGRSEFKETAIQAVQWLFKVRKPSGEIPYVLDGKFPYTEEYPLDTMTYSMEAFVASHTLIADEAFRAALVRDIAPSIEWLLRTQNRDGSWGELRSQDQQRSPGVVTLLAWYYRSGNPDPRIVKAVRQYCRFLLHPENSKAYGVKELVRTTGFVGLVVAELLKPGVTFN
jgi:hypothetical protein